MPTLNAIDMVPSGGFELGTRFDHAFDARDFDAMRSLLHPHIRFRGVSPLTPA